MSLMLNSNSDEETLYSDSVFSTYLYTGNGSTQTITNGIDLAGKGGMVWTKARNTTSYGGIVDTVRGNGYSVQTTTSGELYSWMTVAPGTSPGIRYSDISSFNNNGYSLGYVTSDLNNSATTYASWTFRKAAKFFDVVTYTGDGVAGRQIAHSLGVDPGMIVIKCTSYADNWYVYHRSIPLPNGIFLNLTAAAEDCSTRMNTAPTASVFTVQTDAMVNASGRTYVAYLYAHDTSSTGIIQCGSFTTTGSLVNVTLGYEPQYVMLKRSDNVGDWFIIDSMRGFVTDLATGATYLFANSNAAENSGAAFSPTATGFSTSIGAGSTYIYMAIRRPNKPPTSGTQVYNGSTTTLINVGFTSDMQLGREYKNINAAYSITTAVDRLRGGGNFLVTSKTDAEGSVAAADYTVQYANNQVNLNYGNGAPLVAWNFKRAPGFFDEVCYTGTGSATTQAHNLTVAPELMIVKNRSVAGYSWVVYDVASGNTKAMLLNTTGASTAYAPPVWNDTSPTATVFSVGTSPNNNTSGATYVAYLFASLAGISKVGSYTGNGSSQNIECGFAAGARFVLIKRTDSTGDWYIWDTARGIVTGNDPHLSLNSTATEVTTDDSIDPYSPGFTVNQLAATNINVTSATYIFLAIV